MDPIVGAGLMAGGSLVGQVAGMFQDNTPKISPAFREQILRAMAQAGMMQQIRQPYQYQRTAAMSPFQLAAMGNVANQAFVKGAPQPTTSANQGQNYWQGAMSAPLKPGAPAQGAPQAAPAAPGGAPQGAPAPAPQSGPPTQMADGTAGYNPYANLGYASQFIPPEVMGMFMAPPTSPLVGDPTWSNYYANTPAGQQKALEMDPRLYQSNPWASSNPDRAMALQDPAWVAAHPDKAAKYQKMFDASQQPTGGK